MALSRKKKIIIAVSAAVVLALIIIISVVASRKDEPEVTTVKLDVRPELRSTVTASGEVRPIRGRCAAAVCGDDVYAAARTLTPVRGVRRRRPTDRARGTPPRRTDAMPTLAS